MLWMYCQCCPYQPVGFMPAPTWMPGHKLDFLIFHILFSSASFLSLSFMFSTVFPFSLSPLLCGIAIPIFHFFFSPPFPTKQGRKHRGRPSNQTPRWRSMSKLHPNNWQPPSKHRPRGCISRDKATLKIGSACLSCFKAAFRLVHNI